MSLLSSHKCCFVFWISLSAEIITGIMADEDMNNGVILYEMLPRIDNGWLPQINFNSQWLTIPIISY